MKTEVGSIRGAVSFRAPPARINIEISIPRPESPVRINKESLPASLNKMYMPQVDLKSGLGAAKPMLSETRPMSYNRVLRRFREFPISPAENVAQTQSAETRGPIPTQKKFEQIKLNLSSTDKQTIIDRARMEQKTRSAPNAADMQQSQDLTPLTKTEPNSIPFSSKRFNYGRSTNYTDIPFVGKKRNPEKAWKVRIRVQKDAPINSPVVLQNQVPDGTWQSRTEGNVAQRIEQLQTEIVRITPLENRTRIASPTIESTELKIIKPPTIDEARAELATIALQLEKGKQNVSDTPVLKASEFIPQQSPKTENIPMQQAASSGKLSSTSLLKQEAKTIGQETIFTRKSPDQEIQMEAVPMLPQSRFRLKEVVKWLINEVGILKTEMIVKRNGIEMTIAQILQDNIEEKKETQIQTAVVPTSKVEDRVNLGTNSNSVPELQSKRPTINRKKEEPDKKLPSTMAQNEEEVYHVVDEEAFKARIAATYRVTREIFAKKGPKDLTEGSELASPIAENPDEEEISAINLRRGIKKDGSHIDWLNKIIKLRRLKKKNQAAKAMIALIQENPPVNKNLTGAGRRVGLREVLNVRNIHKKFMGKQTSTVLH